MARRAAPARLACATDKLIAHLSGDVRTGLFSVALHDGTYEVVDGELRERWKSGPGRMLVGLLREGGTRAHIEALSRQLERSYEIEGIDLRGLETPLVRLTDIDLRGAVFDDAQIDVISMTGRVSLRDVLFRRARLIRPRFGCVGRRVDLRGANFEGAELRFASFRDGLCAETCFRDADIRHSDFKGADLIGADLSGANARGSRLQLVRTSHTTRVEGARLTRALLDAPMEALANRQRAIMDDEEDDALDDLLGTLAVVTQKSESEHRALATAALQEAGTKLVKSPSLDWYAAVLSNLPTEGRMLVEDAFDEHLAQSR